jgi:circadian clock protein KaiC
VGSKTVRRIKLRKTRGSGAISGSHEFEINENGIAIYPRLESVVTEPLMMDSDEFRVITSGIPSLDAQIGGGLVASSSTLLMGPSGAGKTCSIGSSR